MPDIEGVNVGGRMRHHGEALASNFIVHMFKSRHRQNLPIMDEFEKQAHFATDANVSARMLKLVKELNWFHAYLQHLDSLLSELRYAASSSSYSSSSSSSVPRFLAKRA